MGIRKYKPTSAGVRFRAMMIMLISLPIPQRNHCLLELAIRVEEIITVELPQDTRVAEIKNFIG